MNIRGTAVWRPLAIALALVLALSSQAAGGVTVMSGEHGCFTRIALDFGHPVDWQVGRTADGYALRVPGEKPEYDLSGVYKLIGRNRIASLWVDPVGGIFGSASAAPATRCPSPSGRRSW